MNGLPPHSPIRRSITIGFALSLIAASPSSLRGAGEAGPHGWPFVPLHLPAVPVVAHLAWVRNPIDAFVVARLERVDLKPNPPADRITLLRRVTCDLTGLVPTPAECSAFLHDGRPDAYERVVDRLLASPQFGERWAQHWLDVVRFAETEGYKVDRLRPNAYRYRDYVIRAFNRDVPYDRFVSQQIAGDELEPGNPDAAVATGFWRLHMEESNGANYRRIRQDILDDNTDVFGSAFLGLTVSCARCHHHKFDPISQRDYYRLQAFFTPIMQRDDLCLAPLDERTRYDRQLATCEQAMQSLRGEIEKLVRDPQRDIYEEIVVAFDPETQASLRAPAEQRTPLQKQLASLASKQIVNRQGRAFRRLPPEKRAVYDGLKKQLDELDRLKPSPLPTAMGVLDVGPELPATYRLGGGSYLRPREEVEPGFPKFLSDEIPDIHAPSERPASTGRRSALARWLTRPDHPLTARVIANRMWQHYFGHGIVGTSNDFGAMGERATHPELLDYLAADLVHQGWKLKTLHRSIVTSATYMQSSPAELNPSESRAVQLDPEDHLLWHAHPRRRDAESLRDATLQVAGRLNPRMYGPSAQPELPDPVSENRYAWTPDTLEEDRNRRSIYVLVKRNMPYPIMAAFDAPDRLNSCPARAVTTGAPQALALLNSRFALTQARHMAGMLLKTNGNSLPSLVRQAHSFAYSREPSAEELTAGVRFLEHQGRLATGAEPGPLPEPLATGVRPALAGAVVDLCHALMNSAEFLYVD